MRIAMVVIEYVTEPSFDGGLANYTQRIATALIAAGHEVDVWVEADRSQVLHDDGVTVYRVGYRRVLWLGFLNLLTWRRFQTLFNFLRRSWNVNAALIRAHREKPYAVVHYTHLCGLGVFRPTFVPAVVRLSSYTPLWQRYGEFLGQSGFLVWQRKVVENWALRRADAVFGPCREIADVVHDTMRIPVEVIESPYLTPRDQMDDSVWRQTLGGTSYVLFFGRLSPSKGVLVMAEMIDRLLRHRPDLSFVFVGKETTGFRGRPIMDHIREQAGDNAQRIIHLGRLPHPQLYPVIANARVVVMPSLIDNFPNACMEAMALGRVVVATAGTGFDQLLRHGVSGWLCRPGDADDLLAAVERAWDMGAEEAQAMGAAARRRVAELDPAVVAARHLELYSRVVERRRK